MVRWVRTATATAALALLAQVAHGDYTLDWDADPTATDSVVVSSLRNSDIKQSYNGASPTSTAKSTPMRSTKLTSTLAPAPTPTLAPTTGNTDKGTDDNGVSTDSDDDDDDDNDDDNSDTSDGSDDTSARYGGKPSAPTDNSNDIKQSTGSKPQAQTDTSGGSDTKPIVHNGGVNLYPYAQDLRDYIVETHNWARSTLVPTPAANMRQLHWDETLAIEASELVDTCLFEHDTESYAYGQNLLYGGFSMDERAVDGWIDGWVTNELSSYDRSGTGFMDLDHASAVLWATSHLVGCASKLCANGYLTACNYYSPGNMQGEQVYVPGPSCSQCPSQAPFCDATGKLCTADDPTGATPTTHSDQSPMHTAAPPTTEPGPVPGPAMTPAPAAPRPAPTPAKSTPSVSPTLTPTKATPYGPKVAPAPTPTPQRTIPHELCV